MATTTLGVSLRSTTGILTFADAVEYSQSDSVKITVQKAIDDLREKVNGINGFKREVVTALPAVADADADTMYLVKRTAGQNGSDIYDEYLLVDGKFEMLGNTQVDFTGYAKEGKSTDAKTALTIYGAKAFATAAADAAKTAVIGAATDTASSDTVKGAKKYADAAKTAVIGAATDTASSDTVKGAKKYADSLAGNYDAAGAASAALASAKSYADGLVEYASDDDIDALFDEE